MARRDGTPRPPKPAATPERQKREARPEKIAAFRVGISAESRAAVWLLAHGYRILARRWKSPLGEIDIIAARRHLLIFVEVKARATLDAKCARRIDVVEYQDFRKPLCRSYFLDSRSKRLRDA